MFTARNEIERGIIVAIIEANAFTDVAALLAVKNFKDKRFQQIFTAAQSLYPSRPIDFITLKIELEKIFKDECDEAITFFYTKKVHIHTKSSVRYWCLVLLQLDIKDAFKSELVKWKEERDRESSPVESAVIEEIFLNVTEDVDILILIEKSMLYFEKHKMSRELSKAQEFEEDVVKKTLKIKKNISLEIALSNVYQIAECSPEVIFYCKKFAEAIAHMTITNKIKSTYTTAANLL